MDIQTWYNILQTMKKTNIDNGFLQEAIFRFNELAIINTENNELARLVGYNNDDEDVFFIFKTQDGSFFNIPCIGGYVFLSNLKTQNATSIEQGHGFFQYNDYERINNWLMGRLPLSERFYFFTD